MARADSFTCCITSSSRRQRSMSFLVLQHLNSYDTMAQAQSLCLIVLLSIKALRSRQITLPVRPILRGLLLCKQYMIITPIKSILRVSLKPFRSETATVSSWLSFPRCQYYEAGGTLLVASLLLWYLWQSTQNRGPEPVAISLTNISNPRVLLLGLREHSEPLQEHLSYLDALINDLERSSILNWQSQHNVSCKLRLAQDDVLTPFLWQKQTAFRDSILDLGDNANFSKLASDITDALHDCNVADHRRCKASDAVSTFLDLLQQDVCMPFFLGARGVHQLTYPQGHLQ